MLSFAQQIKYGAPIAGLVIVIVGIYFWRQSKKDQVSRTGGGVGPAPGSNNATGTAIVNIAYIVSPNTNLIIDEKVFTVDRKYDEINNVEATYAIFPEEKTAQKGGFGNVIAGFKKMFHLDDASIAALATKEKKGTPFNPNLAYQKRGGGWVAMYTLENNTQIPISSSEKVKHQTVTGSSQEEIMKKIKEDNYQIFVQFPVSTADATANIISIKKADGKSVPDSAKFIAEIERYYGVTKTYIVEMERNVEKRIANLKAGQNAALDYLATNTEATQLAGAIRIGIFALVIAVLILAIVVSTLPGSINQIITGAEAAVGSGAKTIGGVATGTVGG